MGASNSYGNIAVQLEGGNYSCGEELTGVIHLSLKSPVPSSTLFLNFFGREKTFWAETRTESSRNADGTSSSKTVTDTYSGKSIICNFFFPLSELKSGLRAGGYSFPFSFLIPLQLPSSFLYDQSVEASITYKLRGILHSNSSKLIKNSLKIWLKSPLVNFTSNLTQERIAQLKTGCFENSGVCKLSVFYPQDCYSPSQVARFNVEIDNTASKVDVTGVRYRFYWALAIRSDHGRSHYLNKTLIRDQVWHRVPAGDKLIQTSAVEISVNLPTLMKDLMMMCSTKAKLIECLYRVEIEAELDASCVCCGQRPCIESLIFIVPDEVFVPSAPDAPNDWNPQVFERVEVSYDRQYEVDKS